MRRMNRFSSRGRKTGLGGGVLDSSVSTQMEDA